MVIIELILYSFIDSPRISVLTYSDEMLLSQLVIPDCHDGKTGE